MRSPTVILLAGMLGVLVYVANFAWWFEREIVDSENFVDSTVVALGREESRDAMGQLIVDRLVDEFPLLIVVESNLVGMFSDLLATPALSGVVTDVGADVHEAIVTGNQDAIEISLEDYRDVIVAPLEAISPQLAGLVPDGWFVSIEVLEAGALPDLSLYARWADLARFLSIIGAAALAASLLWFANRRSVGLMLVGAALIFAGAASAVLVPAGRVLTIGKVHTRSMETLVTITYNEFTESLLLSAVVLVLIGLALIAAGLAVSSASAPTEPTDHLSDGLVDI